MNLRKAKLFLGLFILFVYMGIGVFGLFKFSHTEEMPMADCPYTQNGYSICYNNLDHINNWQQFSNITIPSLFFFLILILGVIPHSFIKRNFLNPNRHFYRWKYYLYKKLYTYKEKIIKWLSLFENSPSISYVRHS